MLWPKNGLQNTQHIDSAYSSIVIHIITLLHCIKYSIRLSRPLGQDTLRVLSVCLSSVLYCDVYGSADAIWDGWLGCPKDGLHLVGVVFLQWEGAILVVDMGHPIVTNGTLWMPQTYASFSLDSSLITMYSPAQRPTFTQR